MGQGSELQLQLMLDTLIHCAWPGIERVSWHGRDAIDPIVPQQERQAATFLKISSHLQDSIKSLRMWGSSLLPWPKDQLLFGFIILYFIGV